MHHYLVTTKDGEHEFWTMKVLIAFVLGILMACQMAYAKDFYINRPGGSTTVCQEYAGDYYCNESG